MAKYLDSAGVTRLVTKLKSDVIPSVKVNAAKAADTVPASGITGVIDISHIPQGALERVVTVADDAARYKLTTSQVQLGDTVKVTATALNIRRGPGTNYGRKGFIAPGVYTIVAEADGTGATKWGKLKSGVGWISLDYVTKTGTGATAAPAIKVGSKVTIDDGAVYGGLATSRGAKVPDYVSGKNRRYTVKQIATHKGVQEALLKEITSWVALSYLTVV